MSGAAEGCKYSSAARVLVKHRTTSMEASMKVHSDREGYTELVHGRVEYVYIIHLWLTVKMSPGLASVGQRKGRT